MQCRACGAAMERERRDRVRLWICSACNVGATTLVSLKHWMPRERWNALRRAIIPRSQGKTSVEVEHEGTQHRFTAADQLLVSDLSFFEDARPKPGLSQPARESVAMAATAIMKDRGKATPLDRPSEDWKWLLSYLGYFFGTPLPFEDGAKVLRRKPWTTWAVGAAMVVAFVCGLYWSPGNWVFRPSDAWRMLGATTLTSFFIHASWVHLLVNLYFLVVFGNNAEDTLGARRFLILLAAGAVAGAAVHACWDPRTGAHVIGASDGISAAIAYAALTHPRRRVGVLGILAVYILWLRVSMRTAFALWLLFQALQAQVQLAGQGSVSYLSHLGGVAAGFVLWLAWRPRPG